MDDGVTEDKLKGMYGINRAFLKVLDDDLKHLLAFWEIRTPEQMAQLEKLGQLDQMA